MHGRTMVEQNKRTLMNSVKLDVASELCSNLSSLIRSKISRLPHLEELVSDYDEVHTGDVSIYNYMWNSKGLRKLHIERAVTSKGIEILHCVLFLLTLLSNIDLKIFS